MLPSSRTASVVSGRLLLSSLGTSGFRDVTETNDATEVSLELMTAHTERERGLVTRQAIM